jgi:hypothetical protein
MSMMREALDQADMATGGAGGSQPTSPATDSPGTGVPSFTADQMAAKDQQISSLRQQQAQYALNEDIRKAVSEEAQASSRDQQLVTEGSLSPEQATSRSTERQTEINTRQQANQAMATDMERYQAMIEEGGKLGRFNEANKLGQEFKLSPDEVEKIQNDASITSPEEMRLSARTIEFEKKLATTPGTEKFDGGRVGTRGTNVDSLSGAEKILHALNISDPQ